jgi:hypothetical protein
MCTRPWHGSSVRSLRKANVMSRTSTKPSGPALMMGSWKSAVPKALRKVSGREARG